MRIIELTCGGPFDGVGSATVGIAETLYLPWSAEQYEDDDEDVLLLLASTL